MIASSQQSPNHRDNHQHQHGNDRAPSNSIKSHDAYSEMARRKETDLVQLGARVRMPLRAALESAARARGVSINAEINERLTKSFEADKLDARIDERVKDALRQHDAALAQAIRKYIGEPLQFKACIS